MADAIDRLSEMDDATLLRTLGFQQQVDEFKSALTDAKTLEGDARKKVADELEHQLTPKVWPSELKYSVERAKRKEKGATTPCSVCEGMVDID